MFAFSDVDVTTIIDEVARGDIDVATGFDRRGAVNEPFGLLGEKALGIEGVTGRDA